MVGLEVPNRLRITVAFPVGELGTCYQQFWAPTHQMREIEEPREQVLHILDDAPPTYAKNPPYTPPRYRLEPPVITKPRLDQM